MKKEIRPENDITMLSVPQVILLCLLTTIVASVATAIVVAQLTAGKPGDTIFQTVDRVTETVIETKTETQNPKTVIIKEGDLVAKAIDSISGTSEALFSQTPEGEIIDLARGFKISENLLITKPGVEVVGSVSAGLAPVGYYSSERLKLWRTLGEEVFKGPFVEFNQGDPKIGQTVIFVGTNGKIIKGLVQNLSQTTIDFSEQLPTDLAGVLLEVGGSTIGFWNGADILRAQAVGTQVSQIQATQFVTGSDEVGVIDDTQTNDDSVTDDEKEAGCLLVGGNYNEYGECLGIDQGQCLSLGGQFNECASACRHDPDAEICTLQCVITCQL